MKVTAFRAGIIGCALLATIALGAPALAQALPDVPPPARYQVDENGVDVARGTMTGTRTDLAIGAEGRAGLSFLRRFGYGQGGHNYDFGLFLFAGQTHAGIGLDSIPFTQNGSTYTVADGSGATLVKSGTTYTLTLSDGTIVVYNYTTTDHLDSQRFSRASSITYPSGETATLTWVSTTWCSNFFDYCQGGTWLTGVRLQAVSSSMGYQLHLNYGAAEVGYPGQATAWRRLDGVTAINTTVEACDPSAHSCSLTNTWPTVGYSGANVTDPEGRTSTYTQGTLSYTIRRPSAPTPNVAYTLTSAYNRYPVTQVQRDGLIWGYNYSVAGNVATMVVTDPGSHTRTILSDLNVGLPTSVTNEAGQTTTYAYDASGRLTRITAPEGNYVELAYDARGNVTTRTTAPKPGSVLPNIVNSAVFPSSCTPRTCNQPESTTDARGNVTEYTYDATHGGLLTATAPAPAAGAARPQTRYAYTALAAPGGGSVYRLTEVSACQTSASCAGTADETRTVIAYAQANLQPSSATSGAGNGSLSATVALGYDHIGRPITVDGPLLDVPDIVRTRYNLAGQVIGTVSPDPDGEGPLKHRAQRITYNSDGQVISVETGVVDSQSDGDWAAMGVAQIASFTYDAAGRRVASSLYAGGVTQALSQTSYNSEGLPFCTAVRMNPALFGAPPSDVCAPAAEGAFGADRIVRTTYDVAHRVDKVQTGVGVTGVEADEVTTTYTANGRVETVTDAEGNRTTYVYDGHDRPSRTRMPDPSTDNSSSTTDYEELTYETVTIGGATQASPLVASRRLRDTTSIGFTYDRLGRLTHTEMPNSATSIFEPNADYSYDLLGRLLSASHPDTNHATFTYDALGRVTSEAGLQGATSMQYDLAGRRTRLTYPGSGLAIDYDYLVTGETAAIRENGATSGAGLLATYAYDNLGRRASLTRGNGTTTGYAYDHASRLTQIVQDLTGTANDLILDFTHNPAGQIATNARSNDTYAWTNHYVVNRNYTANGLNQYTATGSITPSYDARGNLIATGGASFVYNARNQLWWAHPAAPGTALYYDPLGRMSAIIANNWATITHLLHDGGNLIAERDNASGNILRRYVHGPGVDEPLVWYEGSGISDRRWFHADERGSVIAISNGAGSVTNVNSYDEYGIPASTNVGRFQYTGQQWIAELGMYYYRARIYSPTLGRFMQTDPIGFAGGMNIYGYASGDPINSTDPSGLADMNCTGTLICVKREGGDGSTYQFVGICGSCSGSSTESPTGNAMVRTGLVSWELTSDAGLTSGTLRLDTGETTELGRSGMLTLLSISNTQLSYSQISTLVSVLNRSGQPNEFVIALIYKESGFDPNSSNAGAYGLMQVRDIAVREVNRLLGTHHRHSDMFNPVRNIHFGTTYLGLMVDRYGLTYGVNQFYGTGAGYIDSILAASRALPGSADPMATLRMIIGPR